MGGAYVPWRADGDEIKIKMAPQKQRPFSFVALWCPAHVLGVAHEVRSPGLAPLQEQSPFSVASASSNRSSQH